MFPRPGGHAMPVISGLVSDRLDRRGDGRRAGRRAGAIPGSGARSAAVAGDQESAPAQEVVHRAGSISRRSCRCRPTTSTTAAPTSRPDCMIARNPETGMQNVSIHRCQISGPNRIGVLLLPRHTHMFYRHGGERGAAARGRDRHRRRSADAAGLAGDRAARASTSLKIAGALHGAPLEVVKCLTNEVRVPADAEIVIEGRLLPQRARAGRPVRRIPAVLRRARQAPRDGGRPRSRIARTRSSTPSSAAGSSTCCSAAIPREATLLAHLRRSFPERARRASLARRRRAAITSTCRSRSGRRARPRTS